MKRQRPAARSALAFALRFYLGLGAPCERRHYDDCRVRAAQGYSPDLVRSLLAVYLGQSDEGRAERVKPSCCRVTLAGHQQPFFVKEFASRGTANDLERWLRVSRGERAWRAAHLLPRLGIPTPRPIGTALAWRGGEAVEHLITEWVEGAVQFPTALAAAGDGEVRVALLEEFGALMQRCHGAGLYTRDLVKNVLVVEGEDGRDYWLCDLDGVHPYRRVNSGRMLFHMRQLAHYARPTIGEARLICEAYLGTTEGPWAEEVVRALMT